MVEVPGLKWGDDDTKDQMLGRALTYLVLYSTLGMMLRWSWGVKLLSQADDEAPDVDATAHVDGYQALAGTDQRVQSPESLIPHPGARETDPFFATAKGLSQDLVDEQRNPTGSIDQVTSRMRSSSPDPSVPWTAPGSAHSMHPAIVRASSGAAGSASQPPGLRRRDSSAHSSNTRRKPTRTESGREFLGLPSFPKRERIMLPEEDSSDEEDEHNDEWVSCTSAGWLTGRGASHLHRFEGDSSLRHRRPKSSCARVRSGSRQPQRASTRL